MHLHVTEDSTRELPILCLTVTRNLQPRVVWSGAALVLQSDVQGFWNDMVTSISDHLMFYR
jgi:hypothetical protein